jgi:hypothetical protein
MVYASIQRIPKSLFLILLLSVGITKLGCHFSGDGDWGKTVAKDSILYPSLKDCKHARNVNKEGAFITGNFLEYKQQLTEPKYPLPLLDAIVYALIVFASFRIRKVQLEIAGILFCAYSMISSGISQNPFDQKILLFYGITLFFLFIITVIRTRNKHKTAPNTSH